ncbi:hypothetical protein J2S49_000914 [Arcanobacterium wilhelmae]|uniref:Uncharacterized protein n=1 Tax=Arcanobacterium wilhelmae TaxID=1803177 RepID=A0ABT9NBE0_9ACTO|nr:hypothetical protein [Arcanobacterium wilhelmae]MDP9800838.1 hypothetical protein [Arcanobacterium wilhelmae]WFN90212.1 hypothetical protein P8A24_08510 [Arcanobacterium wilhelmae]
MSKNEKRDEFFGFLWGVLVFKVIDGIVAGFSPFDAKLWYHLPTWGYAAISSMILTLATVYYKTKD